MASYTDLTREVERANGKWDMRSIGKVVLLSVVLVAAVVVCVNVATKQKVHERTGLSPKSAVMGVSTSADKINTVCYLPVESGPCYGYFPMYAFNKCTGKCERFVYGGCAGNANKYYTLAQCQSACRYNPPQPCPKLAHERTGLSPQSAVTGVSADKVNAICYLPKETGPCRAAFLRYSFNKCTGKCERFIYGGCAGNANNFQTLAQCQSACRYNSPQPCPKLAEKEEGESATLKQDGAANAIGLDSEQSAGVDMEVLADWSSENSCRNYCYTETYQNHYNYANYLRCEQMCFYGHFAHWTKESTSCMNECGGTPPPQAGSDCHAICYPHAGGSGHYHDA